MIVQTTIESDDNIKRLASVCYIGEADVKR